MLTKTNQNNFYNIFCIIDKIPSFSFEEIINKVYKGKNFKIIFKLKLDDFQNTDTHQWTNAIMWRLQAAKIIDEDKILSFDVDVVFRDDPALFFLNELNTHLGGMLDLMSVEYLAKNKHQLGFDEIGKEKAKNYINYGCVLMNLKKIREDNMYEEFLKLSVKNWFFPEQHIFNISCTKTIFDISYSCFNYWFQYLKKDIFPYFAKSKREMKIALKHTKYVHFNKPKQWSKWCLRNFKLRREWLKINKILLNE